MGKSENHKTSGENESLDFSPDYTAPLSSADLPGKGLPSPGGEAAAEINPPKPVLPDTAGTPEPHTPPGKKFYDYIHPVSFALFILATVSGLLLFAFYKSAAFSDFFNRHISSVFRFLLAKITNPFPFSLAETIIFCLPLFIILVILHTVKLSKQSAAKNCRFILALFSLLSLLFSIFVLNFSPAYRGSALEEKLELDRENVSADELAATAITLLEYISGLLPDINFEYGSFSRMPYTLSEMNSKLNDAFEAASKRYPFVQSMRTNIKPIVLSKPMTYTHISGIYTYYTGEANINTNFPDYMIPFIAAHELSHQRGIAREDEANFMAFLVCIESDDPYILYSGYFNILSYILNSLYSADMSAYIKVWKSVDRRLSSELAAYTKFFNKYRKSKISKVSEAVNDTYLKIQGQSEGTRSYGRVVDLAVAYAKKHYGIQADAAVNDIP